MDKIDICKLGLSTRSTNALKRAGIITVEQLLKLRDDDINNIKRSEKEQKKIFKEINKEDNWIIEGTLRKHLFYLCEMADKIIYLDVPVKVRKRRILTRFVRQLFGIEKCNYTVNLKMLKLMYKWTNEFERDKSFFEEKLFTYRDKVIVVSDDKLML